MSMVEFVEGGPEEVVEGQEVEDVSELTVASVDEGGREDDDVEDEEAKLGGDVVCAAYCKIDLHKVFVRYVSVLTCIQPKYKYKYG